MRGFSYLFYEKYTQMSRNRAERRHNTEVKTSARKALAIRGEIDQAPAGGYCGGKIGPDGEARSCGRCETCRKYEETYIRQWDAMQLSSYLKSFE